MLVRHPMDVVRSNFHFRVANLHMKTKWGEAFIADRLKAWAELYVTWLENFRAHMQDEGSFDSVLLVHYEKLKEDPARELRRIFDWLGISVSTGKINCAVREASGKHVHELSNSDLMVGKVHVNISTFFLGRKETEKQFNNLPISENIMRKLSSTVDFERIAKLLGYNINDILLDKQTPHLFYPSKFLSLYPVELD